MSYVKQTWVTGEVITADKLNHMEDGIANAFPVAELVKEDSTFTVKATPDTIESVFLAVGENFVFYRTYSFEDTEGKYAVFMGTLSGVTVKANLFTYDAEAGGYVYNGLE